MTIQFTAKCVVCKKKSVLTEADVKLAQQTGCAMCPKCGCPATICKVSGRKKP